MLVRIFLSTKQHCRQNLRVTMAIRRFCPYLVKLHQSQILKLATITYYRYQRADLRKLLSMRNGQVLSAAYLSIIMPEPAWGKLLICSLQRAPLPQQGTPNGQSSCR